MKGKRTSKATLSRRVHVEQVSEGEATKGDDSPIAYKYQHSYHYYTKQKEKKKSSLSLIFQISAQQDQAMKKNSYLNIYS